MTDQFQYFEHLSQINTLFYSEGLSAKVLFDTGLKIHRLSVQFSGRKVEQSCSPTAPFKALEKVQTKGDGESQICLYLAVTSVKQTYGLNLVNGAHGRAGPQITGVIDQMAISQCYLDR